MRKGVSRTRGVATRNAMVTFTARRVAEQFGTPMIGRVGVAGLFGDDGDRLRRGRGAIWDASERLRRGRESQRNDMR